MAEAADTDNGEIADVIKQLLECSVCLKRFTDPKSLSCYHAFCKTCLETLVVNDNKISCPQCGAPHILSADGISELSTNYTIVSLMNLYPIIDERASHKHACALCATELLPSDLTACPHCGDVICSVCSISHVTEIKESLFSSAQHMHGDVGRIYDARNQLKVDLSQLKQQSEDVKTQINENVNRIILELRERQKGLCQQVDEYVAKESSPLQSGIARLEDELVSRLLLSPSVDSAMAKILSNVESGIESLMLTSAQCSDYSDEDCENLSSSFQNRTNHNVNFVPINAQELNHSILRFGEITTETRERILCNSADGSAMVTTSRTAYYERQGNVLIDIDFETFGTIIDIAVSPSGDRIYLASLNDTLEIFDERGRHIKSVRSPGGGVGGFESPAGIAVNSDCDVIVSDSDNNRIIILNREGEYMFSFGERGSDDGQLNQPQGLAVDVAFNIYVCDTNNQRVQVFNRYGTFIRKFAELESTPYEWLRPKFHPVYLAIAPDTDLVYVTDNLNHTVHLFSTQGEYVSIFGDYGTDYDEISSPWGIGVDDAGYVIISDSEDERVQVFLADGTFYCTVDSYGAEKTRFCNPESLAVDKNNRLFVIDDGSMKVIVF